jgi:hypothetical protein
MEELIALLRFAINNEDKFTEWDPDQVKCQWIEAAKRAVEAAQQGTQSDWATTSTQNVLALLEECFENGNAGQEQLYAWFSDQAEVIEQAIEEARLESRRR